MGFLDHLDLPSANGQPGRSVPKGQSRLEVEQAAKPITVVDERAFLKKVRTRDAFHCRMCLRKVIVQLRRDPLRAEVHHLHGRRGDFRFDDRCALLVCQADHEKLTGKVNAKWRAVGTVFVEVDGQLCIDARALVRFERIV